MNDTPGSEYRLGTQFEEQTTVLVPDKLMIYYCGQILLCMHGSSHVQNITQHQSIFKNPIIIRKHHKL